MATQDNDGADNCDPYCFTMKPVGNHVAGDWDLLAMELKVPGQVEGNAEADQLIWEVVIPTSSNTATITLEVSCANSANYWGSMQYFGLEHEDALTYPKQIEHWPMTPTGDTYANSFTSINIKVVD